VKNDKTNMKEESSVSESEEERVSGEEIRESDDKEKNEVTNSRDKTRQKRVHKLSLTATEDFSEELRKRGVIYIARVPPRMNPTKIKALLSDFGTVTRVYLVEEDAARRKRRRKATGNATKRYMEGWVEFKDKGIAKHVARSLNNTPISMHKRNVHYGKLACLGVRLKGNCSLSNKLIILVYDVR
jgi:ESF2/ABP1 family protein